MKNTFSRKICRGSLFGLLVLLQVQAYAKEKMDPSPREIAPPVPSTRSAPSAPVYDKIPTFWLGAEYIYWDIQSAPQPLPLLVGTNDSLIGPVLGKPNTFVVLGGEDVNLGWRSGGNFYAGYRFGESRSFGVEADYFFLPFAKKTTTVVTTAPGSFTNYYIPYINAVSGVLTSRLIAVSGNYGGPISLKISNKMQGAEVNSLSKIFCNRFGHIDLLGGARYVNFKEDLKLFINTPFVPGSVFSQNVYQLTDEFNATNNFIGGQFGIKGEYSYKKFFINATGKLALGAMLGSVDIEGKFVTNDIDGTVGLTQTFAGGFFALPTNIGTHKATRFSILPEINAKLGYQFFDRFRIQVGYTFLYLTGVFRPGNQMDNHLNISQSSIIQSTPNPALVGTARPKALMSTSGLWVQGMNAGLEFGF